MESESIVHFRQRLAAKAQRCYWNQDIAGILAVLETIDRKMQTITDINARGKLDNSAAHTILLAAEAHLDDLDFESCFCLCHDAQKIIENCDQRYRDAGQTPPPNSLIRIALLDNLADAKWKMPDPAHIDRVMPGLRMIDSFVQLVPGTLERLRGSNHDKLAVEKAVHSMLCAGVMLYKQALRFHPHACPQIESVMDRLLPGVLENEELSYFWDVLIARHVLKEKKDRSRLSYYYSQRKSCYSRNRVEKDHDNGAYDRSAANEMEYLLGCRLETWKSG